MLWPFPAQAGDAQPIKEWSLTSLKSARTFAEIFSQRYERGSTLEPRAALLAGAAPEIAPSAACPCVERWNRH
jgi:hypothetical protein